MQRQLQSGLAGGLQRDARGIDARTGVRAGAQRQPERRRLFCGEVEGPLLQKAARCRHHLAPISAGEQQLRGDVPLARAPSGALRPEVHVPHVARHWGAGEIDADRKPLQAFQGTCAHPHRLILARREEGGELARVLLGTRHPIRPVVARV